MGSVLEKNSSAVRKRIEGHTFEDETGEEYEASKFGRFDEYFRRKKIKLQNLDSELREAAAGKPQIFKGTVVHVFGYTQPPLHILHRELVQHGAGFLQYLDSKTMATHIVTSSLPPKKVVDFNKYRIVTPAWVTESIKAGRMLPWTDFRVIDEGPRQKTLRLDGGKVLSQSTTPNGTKTYRTQTQNSFYTSQLKVVAERIDNGESSVALVGAEASQRMTETHDEDRIGAVDATDVSQQETVERRGDNEDRIGEVDYTDIIMADQTSDTCVATDAAVAESSEAVPHDATFETAARSETEKPQGAMAATSEMGKPQEEMKAKSEMEKPPGEMTSEEHNAWLLSDPKIRKASSANPDFLKQFYSESRLHHLSTWKAELKSRMQKLAAERGHQPKAVKRKPGARRYIMHVDFDSFFCAVSLKKAPEYRDKPACVAHGTGSSSEIASCNYAAREFGITNGMWMKKARELCPQLKVLPYDFPGYEEASKHFYEAILDIGGVVQSVSIDEAFVDITSLVLPAGGSDGLGVSEGSIWREQEKAEEIARQLRERVKEKTSCSVSVGIGGNVLQAKVALRKGKPDGQYLLKPEDVLEVIGELEVEDLPGVAYSLGGKLEEMGVKYVKDIRALSRERLCSILGPKTGEKLFEFARGIDRTEVGEQPARKSVSAEINWGIRFISQEEADEFVMNLCKELERRLLKEGVKGSHLTMRIMRRSLDAPLDPVKHLGHGKCDMFSKSSVFGVATNSAETIGREAVSILRSFRFSPGDLRGLGVQLTKLEPIKATGSGPDGNQMRLSFGTLSKPSRPNDDIEDVPSPLKKGQPDTKMDHSSDPIDDTPTPKKPLSRPPEHPALALTRAAEQDDHARVPLNISGTQFLLPSNPDPAVVAELPPDVRSRLLAKGSITAGAERGRSDSPSVTSAPHPDLPPDVDPDVFAALPADVQAEVLADYRRRNAGAAVNAQQERTLRHQSPTAAAAVSKKTTPTKSRGTRPGLLTKRERAADAHARLLQTNFLSGASTSATKKATAVAKQPPPGDGFVDDDAEEPDPDFLAALPEDVRREVLADHRRRRLALRGGLNVEDRFGGGRRVANWATSADLVGQTQIRFPRARTIATLAGAGAGVGAGKGASFAEVKTMLEVWHSETTVPAGEDGSAADDDGSAAGPHEEDVDIFARYLRRVVLDERDLDKAVRTVNWLAFLIDAADEGGAAGRGAQQKTGEGSAQKLKSTAAAEAWRRALARMQSEIQAAVRERGLAPVKFA